jgi:hypothetical protein
MKMELLRYRGSGFRQSTKGGAIVLAILPHLYHALSRLRKRMLRKNIGLQRDRLDRINRIFRIDDFVISGLWRAAPRYSVNEVSPLWEWLPATIFAVRRGGLPQKKIQLHWKVTTQGSGFRQSTTGVVIVLGILPHAGRPRQLLLS